MQLGMLKSMIGKGHMEPDGDEAAPRKGGKVKRKLIGRGKPKGGEPDGDEAD